MVFNSEVLLYLSIFQMGASLRTSMVSITSQIDLDIKQIFTQVGTYRNSIVAIKQVGKKYVDLTRDVRKELKMVAFGVCFLCNMHRFSSVLLLNQRYKREWFREH